MPANSPRSLPFVTKAQIYLEFDRRNHFFLWGFIFPITPNNFPFVSLPLPGRRNAFIVAVSDTCRCHGEDIRGPNSLRVVPTVLNDVQMLSAGRLSVCLLLQGCTAGETHGIYNIELPATAFTIKVQSNSGQDGNSWVETYISFRNVYIGDFFLPQMWSKDALLPRLTIERSTSLSVLKIHPHGGHVTKSSSV